MQPTTSRSCVYAPLIHPSAARPRLVADSLPLLIRLQVIATGELGLELGPEFGVAPSTLSFRAGEVAGVPGSGGSEGAKL